MRDWWKRFFRASTYPLEHLVNDRATRAEVRQLARLLPVGRGAKILDVACGTGRHSLLLAKHGYRVTGVDYSSSYLGQARNSARRLGAPVEWLRRDMRHLGFHGEFDAALNLWTSLGYFPRFSDDLRALRSMRRALKPGGWLVVELMNADWCRKHFMPRHWYEGNRHWALEAARIRDGADPAVISERVYIGPDGRVSRGRTFVRLYDRRRLKRALDLAGFKGVRVTGGFLEGGRPLSQCRRILALARKPLRGRGEK